MDIRVQEEAFDLGHEARGFAARQAGMGALVTFTGIVRDLEGDDLKAVFDSLRAGEGGWTQTRVLGAILKVCEAMAYAHSKKVIHRDLKPANIMIGRFGEAYVMDWGLAHVLGEQDRRDIRVREPEAALSVYFPASAATAVRSPSSSISSTVV